jgi:hypothetical protein
MLNGDDVVVLAAVPAASGAPASAGDHPQPETLQKESVRTLVKQLRALESL